MFCTFTCTCFFSMWKSKKKKKKSKIVVVFVTASPADVNHRTAVLNRSPVAMFTIPVSPMTLFISTYFKHLWRLFGISAKVSAIWLVKSEPWFSAIFQEKKKRSTNQHCIFLILLFISALPYNCLFVSSSMPRKVPSVWPRGPEPKTS